MWSLFRQSSSESLPLSQTGHLAQGRAKYVSGALGECAILRTLPWTQSSVGNSRLLSHHWLPVSRVHQLRSEAEFLEALVAHHNDNGRGCG